MVASEFTPREKEIVMHLRNFNKMAERAARNFDPSEVVRYLETLTAMFPNSEQEPLVHRREIAELALPVMGQALKLLGI
ncbi:DALR anticodon-binding domain-containing protein, partial [Shewanella algae]|uniref:DALR anticodon-binding domain-containing protein n=1 Tax=Shewanella algae TaxID=38313 RepID=UPI00313E9B34